MAYTGLGKCLTGLARNGARCPQIVVLLGIYCSLIPIERENPAFWVYFCSSRGQIISGSEHSLRLNPLCWSHDLNGIRPLRERSHMGYFRFTHRACFILKNVIS